MSEDHDRIDELLAGYVLRSLSGEDAEAADRLLSEHVPACALCRDTLVGFQAVTGELALAAAPLPPPDLVLPRIHRALSDVPVARRRFSLVVAAAGVAAVVGMASLSVSLASRVTRAEGLRSRLVDAITTAAQPGSTPTTLRSREVGGGRLVEISGSSVRRMYLVGTDVPAPSSGHSYQVWLGSDGRFVPVGDMFEPENGLVVLVVTADVSRYDQILITEEVAGSAPAEPSGAWLGEASL